LKRLIAVYMSVPTPSAEILHGYTAIDKREAIGPTLQVTLDIVDEVIPIEKADALRAGEIAQNHAAIGP
jgi:hypothetical protein